MMHYIENDRIKVAVADHGAELCGIYDKKRGHEVVWQADPKYWNRHAPVLFPFVGKVCGGQYRYKGVSYPMGQHGFARDMDFTLVSKTDDSVTYLLKSDEATLAKYPFEFELEITHRIEGNKVYVEWKVTNPSKEEPLYFSIGAHPAFNVPVLPGTKKDDYFVVFEGKDELEYVYLDPVAEAADAENPHKLVLDGGFMPVTMDLFDNDAFIFDHGQVERVAIYYPDKTPYVTIDCKGFPSVGVWSKPKTDAPYICLEPWIGRVDNKGFTGELPEKFEEQCALPGESFEAVYTITVD